MCLISLQDSADSDPPELKEALGNAYFGHIRGKRTVWCKTKRSQPTTREHSWLTLDIQFHSENWILNQFSRSLWDDELLWNLLSIKTFFPIVLLNGFPDDLMIAIARTELKLIYRPISVSIITKIEAIETI